MKQQHPSPGRDGQLGRNAGQSRYELSVDGKLAAFADYVEDGDTVRFTHTQVQQEFEGQGMGSRLAAFALDDVKSRGLKAVPQCRFIAAYVAKNEKEYGDVVAG